MESSVRLEVQPQKWSFQPKHLLLYLQNVPCDQMLLINWLEIDSPIWLTQPMYPTMQIFYTIIFCIPMNQHVSPNDSMFFNPIWQAISPLQLTVLLITPEIYVPMTKIIFHLKEKMISNVGFHFPISCTQEQLWNSHGKISAEQNLLHRELQSTHKYFPRINNHV